MLIGFNVFLIGVCLVTAGGILYTLNKFGDHPRVELTIATTVAVRQT